MNGDPIEHYYNEVRTDYGINSLRRRKVLRLAKAEPYAHARILDIGCSGGYVSRELKTETNFIAGLDIAQSSVEAAKRVLDDARVFDVEREPWPEEFLHHPFNIIICAELIEHLFDPRAFLRRLHEIIWPDGAVILTTPNFLVWNNRLRMLLGRYGSKEVFLDQGHIHLFSYHGIMDVVREEGFHVTAEDSLWYPNWTERICNLRIYESVGRYGSESKRCL